MLTTKEKDVLAQGLGIPPENLRFHISEESVEVYDYIEDLPRRLPRRHKRVYMKLDDTNCCGLGEISGLDEFGALPFPAAKLFMRLVERAARNANKGQLFATTALYQKEAIEKLEACTGWSQVKEFYNPNSGNRVILWTRTISCLKRRDAEDDDSE